VNRCENSPQPSGLGAQPLTATLPKGPEIARASTGRRSARRSLSIALLPRHITSGPGICDGSTDA
jgi:hypothetical protein